LRSPRAAEGRSKIAWWDWSETSATQKVRCRVLAQPEERLEARVGGRMQSHTADLGAWEWSALAYGPKREHQARENWCGSVGPCVGLRDALRLPTSRSPAEDVGQQERCPDGHTHSFRRTVAGAAGVSAAWSGVLPGRLAERTNPRPRSEAENGRPVARPGTARPRLNRFPPIHAEVTPGHGTGGQQTRSNHERIDGCS
jgi:hypothetical protein